MGRVSCVSGCRLVVGYVRDNFLYVCTDTGCHRCNGYLIELNTHITKTNNCANKHFKCCFLSYLQLINELVLSRKLINLEIRACEAFDYKRLVRLIYQKPILLFLEGVSKSSLIRNQTLQSICLLFSLLRMNYSGILTWL